MPGESNNYFYGYSHLETDIGGNQSIQDSSKHLLYNGIIYNTPERIHDGQFLLGSLRSGGVDITSKLQGMFAFAFHDRNNYIHLVRDSIGIKPLYYIKTKNIFGFASEVKALVEISQKNNSEIFEVLPGEIISFSQDSFETKQSRIQNNHTGNITKNGVKTKKIDEIMAKALIIPSKRYLNCGKKIAVLLSGGVDSSIITQKLLCSGIQKNQLMFFCLGGDTSSDSITVRKLAENLEINIQFISPYSDTEAIEKIPEIVKILESGDPRVIRAGILQFRLAEAIRKQNIDIVISGEGADELFWGYERFYGENIDTQDTQKAYNAFFTEIFPRTLMQRLDRIFSYFTIEARVPFLHQDFVDFSKNLDYREKINIQDNLMVNKLILRRYAREIGLPEYIYKREKEKMTKGVTGEENTYSHNQKLGYLDTACLERHNTTLSQISFETYEQEYFQYMDQSYRERYLRINELFLSESLHKNLTHNKTQKCLKKK